MATASRSFRGEPCSEVPPESVGAPPGARPLFARMRPRTSRFMRSTAPLEPQVFRGFEWRSHAQERGEYELKGVPGAWRVFTVDG